MEPTRGFTMALGTTSPRVTSKRMCGGRSKVGRSLGGKRPQVSRRLRHTRERQEPSVSNRDYSLFGLKVSSELELPELFLDESHAAADVTIGRDRIVGEWAAGLHEHDG